MPTPLVPGWIRDYRTRCYTNVYALCPDETRLYGTESLYGDWDGQLLLLAKDFAPSSLVRQRLAAGETRPYRHTDWRTEPRAVGATTNRNLCCFAQSAPCGKLYGSVMAGLLRDDDRISGPLPDLRQNMPFLRSVLQFTLSHMPNLRVLACLGEDAWGIATEVLGCAKAEWSAHRHSREAVNAGSIKIMALAHPSRYPPGGKARVIGDWQAMLTHISDTSGR